MKTRSVVPTALLAPFLASMVLAGCAGAVDPDPDAPTSAAVVQGEIGFRADTQIMESFPVQLRTTVVMVNRAKGTTRLDLASGCPVQLRVYRNEERTRLAWDQGRVIACTQQIQTLQLAPSDTAQRSAGSNAREILGDSLPDGRYWLSAYVQVVGAPLLVPAGAADLGVPR